MKLLNTTNIKDKMIEQLAVLGTYIDPLVENSIKQELESETTDLS